MAIVPLPFTGDRGQTGNALLPTNDAVSFWNEARHWETPSYGGGPQPTKPSPLEQETSPALVMIAVHSPTTRRVLGFGLRRVGISSALYSDGAAILNALCTEPTIPALVILEVDLPRLDGGRVIQAIRTQRKFRQTRIVLMIPVKNRSFARFTTRFRRVDGFITLPIVQEQLLQQFVDPFIPQHRRHANADDARAVERSTECT